MDTSYRQFIETADRYLRGQMDASEREAFEARLATDESFRRAFDQHAAIAEGLQRAFFTEQVQAYMRNQQPPETKKPGGRGGRLLLWVALAGTVLSLVFIGVNAPWWSPAPDKKQLEPVPVPKNQPKGRIAFTPDGQEPLVGTGKDYPVLLPQTTVEMREIRVQNGAYAGSAFNGVRWQVSVYQRPGASSYLLAGDTLQVLMQALIARPDVALAQVYGEKTWYLRLDKQWYRIEPSDGEKPLLPERGPDRLHLLNQY